MKEATAYLVDFMIETAFIAAVSAIVFFILTFATGEKRTAPANRVTMLVEECVDGKMIVKGHDLRAQRIDSTNKPIKCDVQVRPLP